MVQDSVIQLQVVFPLMAAGGLMVAVGVFLGAYLMFKGKADPTKGETFLGRAAKGDVFTIPDGSDSMFPEEVSETEETMLKKTKRFLNALGGKNEN